VNRILVTGGAGFIGSNFVRYLLKKGGYQIVVLDKLTYAGNLDNFPDDITTNPNFQFIKGDIADRTKVRSIYKTVDAVVHFAAETHIDRSIAGIEPFVQTDFVGSYVLLDEFKNNPRERFIQISTSEVYGSAQKIPMAEDHPLEPQSPYAATKAAADRLAYSFFKTYNLPVIIIRPFNNYGPNQYPEKLIPFFVTNALENRPLLVYGHGKNTRDWLYVEDCCALLEKILNLPIDKIKGEVINLGTGKEADVLLIARTILDRLGKPENLIKHIEDRPGHVERLVASTKKMEKLLGMKPTTDFKTGLAATIDWFSDHRQWWEKIKKKKEYQEFETLWFSKLQ
jgi:dTDP-glucose 4,6-dehydratase